MMNYYTTSPLSQEVKVDPTKIHNTGILKVPDIGDNIYVMFLSSDPYSLVYLPFGVSYKGFIKPHKMKNDKKPEEWDVLSKENYTGMM